MEDIIIRIKGDAKDIDGLIKQLEKTKQVDSEVATQFKKNNEEFKKQQKEKSKAVNDATGTIGKALGGINDQLKDVGKTLLAAFAVQSIIAFGAESVKAFQEAELNAKKLSFALTTIGNEGGAAFERLIKQSERLQDISIFSDDDIQRAQTQLVQFGLTADEIERLIPKILDLASATGMDLGQATDTVIQGINGITRGLRPLGLEFQDTGNKAENLAIITDKLNKYQGQTGAILETSAGQWQRFKNKIDDAKESIGGFILSYVSELGAAGDIAKALFDKLLGVKEEVSVTGRKSFLQKYADADELGKKKLIEQQNAAIKVIEKTNEVIKTRLKTTADVSGVLRSIAIGVKEVEKLRAEIDLALNPKGTNLGLTEAEKEKRAQLEAQKRQKELEERKKRQQEIAALELDLSFNVKKEIENDERDKNKIKNELIDKHFEKVKANAEKEVRLNKLKLDEQIADEEEAERKKQQLIDSGFDIASQGLITLQAINDAALQNELMVLEDQLEKKQITQEQFDQKAKIAKQKAAEENKKFAIFNILLSTAQAVIGALAMVPPNPVLAITAGVVGALQLAAAASTPVPQFKEGTEYLKLGRNKPGIDTIPILANEGEAIIPTDKNKKYPGMAAAWIRGNLDDYINTKFIMPNMNKKQNGESFAEKMAKAISQNSGFYDGNLLSSDKSTRALIKEQTEVLKRVLNKNNNSRYAG